MSAKALESRRTDIADALLRAVARGGLSAVSMRVVAAEANCSLGLVQRVMGTKEELLAAGMQRIIERVEARAEAAGLDESLPARKFLEGLLLLLTDDDHREEGLVWAAFSAQALVTPSLADGLRGQEDEAQAAMALVLRSAMAGGDLSADVNPDGEALTLLCLANGLGTQMLLGRCDGAQAHAAIRTHLDRLFQVR
ncbi:MAG: TetR/AcrR family transcriptional regulator [Solirubrobacteraceae bacterium]